MRKTLVFCAALSSVVSLGVQPAFAQRGPGMRHEVRARVSEAVVSRIIAALALDPATAARLRQIVDRHGPGIEAAEQQQARLRKQLKQLVGSGNANPAALTQTTDQLLAGREQHRLLVEARQHEVRAMLAPSQFAALILEYPKIEREVKESLLRAAGRGEIEE